MTDQPIQGPALMKVLDSQRPAIPEAASPTGPVRLPVRLVPWLVLLGAIASVWQAVELYDFAAKVWHPERVPLFVTTLLSTLGIVSAGWRKAGPMIALLFCLSLPTMASASTRAMYEPDRPGLLAAPPELGELVDLAVGPGVDVRAGVWTMGVNVLGTVGLVDIKRFTLTLALGGGVLLPKAGPEGVGKLGVGFQLPGKVLRWSLVAGAAYHLPTETVRAGWGSWGALLLHF